jgi:DNA-binding response OmpR family regulator
VTYAVTSRRISDAGFHDATGLQSGALELLCLARDAAQMPAAIGCFNRAGAEVRTARSLRVLFAAAYAESAARQILLLDIEPHNGISGLYDRLTRLRQEKPEVVVILASAMTRTDDLDTTRLAICDATVRLPVSAARFHNALDAAMMNNMTWCVRQIKLAAEQGAAFAPSAFDAANSMSAMRMA